MFQTISVHLISNEAHGAVQPSDLVGHETYNIVRNRWTVHEVSNLIETSCPSVAASGPSIPVAELTRVGAFEYLWHSPRAILLLLLAFAKPSLPKRDLQKLCSEVHQTLRHRAVMICWLNANVAKSTCFGSLQKCDSATEDFNQAPEILGMVLIELGKLPVS